MPIGPRNDAGISDFPSEARRKSEYCLSEASFSAMSLKRPLTMCWLRPYFSAARRLSSSVLPDEPDAPAFMTIFSRSLRSLRISSSIFFSTSGAVFCRVSFSMIISPAF